MKILLFLFQQKHGLEDTININFNHFVKLVHFTFDLEIRKKFEI